jgi:hypothetical protein
VGEHAVARGVSFAVSTISAEDLRWNSSKLSLNCFCQASTASPWLPTGVAEVTVNSMLYGAPSDPRTREFTTIL